MTSSVKEASTSIPQHVAIIMDGNGRWAKSQGMPRIAGHKKGAGCVRDVVEWASDAGIKQISLYAFSTENWKRPKAEITALMTLMATLLPLEISRMNARGARLLTLGDISKLPWIARKALKRTCEATQYNTDIDVILCLNYGGQQEIIASVQSFCEAWQQGGCSPEQLAALTVENFSTYLPRKDVLPVDLLIRTGGECRISNFYLWDAAYAELYFTDCLWPDYSRDELQRALDDYASRERRFGRTSEQVQALEHE